MNGFCECGCGQKTRLAPQTMASRSWIKGQPIRFVRGHQNQFNGKLPVMKGDKNPKWNGGRTSSGHGPYPCVRQLGHPRANTWGYVQEHILVAERALGRYIELPVEVHHVNEDKGDPSPNNLVICPNHAYHMLLHRRRNALLACGHADWRKCSMCGNYVSPEDPDMRIKKLAHYHKSCQSKYDNQRRVKI